jgi:hypothetical protein
VSAALAGWHEFYGLIGTAAATLIGAMFVVVSIGSGFLTPERAAAVRVFLTPTVIHLAAVLFACALSLVPSLGTACFVGLIGGAGVAGLLHSGHILFVRIWRHNVDHGDRIWYAALPFAGYAVMLAAAAASCWRPAAGLDLLAAALALLLAAGIRNSWDMIVFLVIQPRGSG